VAISAQPNAFQIWPGPIPNTFDPVNLGNGITLSNGNLTGESIGAEDLSTARSLYALTDGVDYYWEIEATAVANGNYVVGIVNSTKNLDDWVASGTGDGVGINPDGNVYWNGSNNGTITDTWDDGDIVCVYYKRSNETIRFRINDGAWSSWTDVSSFFSGDTMYAAVNGGITGNIYTAAFSRADWTYEAPDGARALAETSAATRVLKWNSADKDSTINLSNGDLTMVGTGAGFNSAAVRATVAISGKIYWEIDASAANADYSIAGILNDTASTATFLNGIASTEHFGIQVFNTASPREFVEVWTGSYASTGTTATNLLGIAVDTAAEKLWFRSANNSWLPSGDPAAGTGGYDISTITGTWYPAAGSSAANAALTVLFDEADWQYTAPSGFVELGDTSAPASYTLTASAGSFTLTGVDASLERSYTLTAAAGSFALTGIAANLVRGYRVVADAGTFALTGIAASTLYSRLVAANVGSFTLTGVAAGMLASRILTASAGSFTLTGIDAGLVTSRTLVAEAGSFTLTGNDATLTYGSVGSYTLTADVGSFALTGNDATLTVSRLLTAEPGSFDLTGIAANLIYDGTPVVEPPGGGLSYGGGAAPSRKRLQQILDEFRVEKRSEREKLVADKIAKRPRVISRPPRVVVGPEHTSDDDDEEALAWILESTL
jgi:hypothetical protein